MCFFPVTRFAPRRLLMLVCRVAETGPKRDLNKETHIAGRHLEPVPGSIPQAENIDSSLTCGVVFRSPPMQVKTCPKTSRGD